MRLFADFESEKDKNFDTVYLSYSVLCVSPEGKWFCRIYRKDWIKKLPLQECGESYGKNKFEAYRKAKKDLIDNYNTRRNYA